jgi:hypothetical protein
MDNLGWAHNIDFNAFTMKEFNSNSFVLPFDLFPDLSNGATLSQLYDGSLDFF